jgi:RHS repeat-associated protein
MTYAYVGGTNRLDSIAEAVATTGETWDAEDGKFTYDANGNMKTAPAPYSLTSVTYDAANLPLSLTRSGTTTSYRYESSGQRITKQVGSGNTEVYVRDGAVTLGVFTLNGSGTATSWTWNLLAGRTPVGRQPNSGSRSYYHTDLLGSTRSVTQGATVTESYDFEPWGLLMPGRTLGSGTKEGFTGKEQDTETGLDYFGARYYMPAIGRWSSVDPLAASFPEWSTYNYVLNSPISGVDPDGRAARSAGGSTSERIRAMWDATPDDGSATYTQGDPVNFSDPLGLSPCPPLCPVPLFGVNPLLGAAVLGGTFLLSQPAVRDALAAGASTLGAMGLRLTSTATPRVKKSPGFCTLSSRSPRLVTNLAMSLGR